MPRFYHFHQNNSGGFCMEPACEVFIEAGSAQEANAIALDVGLYFDGCYRGLDCDCCGDRWYEASERDAFESDGQLQSRIQAYSWSADRNVPHTLIVRKGA